MALERAKAGFQLASMPSATKPPPWPSTPTPSPHLHTARNRIEHAQVVDPADIPRFKKLASSPPCSPATCSLT